MSESRNCSAAPSSQKQLTLDSFVHPKCAPPKDGNAHCVDLTSNETSGTPVSTPPPPSPQPQPRIPVTTSAPQPLPPKPQPLPKPRKIVIIDDDDNDISMHDDEDDMPLVPIQTVPQFQNTEPQTHASDNGNTPDGMRPDARSGSHKTSKRKSLTSASAAKPKRAKRDSKIASKKRKHKTVSVALQYADIRTSQ